VEESVAVVALRAGRNALPTATEHDVEAFIVGLVDGTYAYLTPRMTFVAQVELESDLEIEPGSYAVFRHGTSSAHAILDAADATLAADAGALRAAQQEWKDLLYADMNRRGGEERVAGAIRARGVDIHSGMIKRWANDPTLMRPNNAAAFLAMLELVGYSSDQARAIDANMQRLRGAHVKAGNELRKLLLAELDGAALGSQFGAPDQVEISLPGTGAVRLDAVRVVEVERAMVPADQLGMRFRPGGTKWLS